MEKLLDLIFMKMKNQSMDYSKTKLDKTPTKAFTQFRSKQLWLILKLELPIKEKEREYKDRNNETRVGINKNIMWFSTPSTIEEYAEQKFTLEQEKNY